MTVQGKHVRPVNADTGKQGFQPADPRPESSKSLTPQPGKRPSPNR